MNQEYKCPYCGQEEYAKTSSKQGKFNSWEPVIKHQSRCSKVTHCYIITKEYGPILVSELLSITAKEIKIKYPKANIAGKLHHLRKSGIISSVPALCIKHTKDDIIKSIQFFVSNYGRIPAMREFTDIYPSYTSAKRLFGSWNNAIEAAGFAPMIQNGYGNNTYGLDGNLYRSAAEAYFSDTYLYNRYTYIVEPRYPDPYVRYYDWYVKDLDLYIELDGGLRPHITQEKIAINKILNRYCLFITTDNIYNHNKLTDFIT